MDDAKTLGIVGGGQLGRMLTLAAKPLGFNVVVVDPKPGSPASQVGAEEITADLYDPSALQKLAEKADFITIEIEHLAAEVLDRIASLGNPVNPAPDTIRLIQDKFKQKEFLAANGVAVAPYSEVTDAKQAKQLLTRFGGKMLIKTRTGAFDGRGNRVVANAKQVDAALADFGSTPLYAEAFVPFTKELAVLVARATDGKLALYPVVETMHTRNICDEVLAPARVSDGIRAKAENLARRTAGLLNGAGIFAIEMFLGRDGQVLVNEIAPRVHNSGHFTSDACHTSQFEQHVRAVTGLPLGRTDLTVPAAAMVNILGERDGETTVTGLDKALGVPETAVHLYGKSPTKIDRKMGHITSTGDTIDSARQRARRARKHLSV